MSNPKIVERAKKKLTVEEFIHLKDSIICEINKNFSVGYTKGYNAGKKCRKGKSKEGKE